MIEEHRFGTWNQTPDSADYQTEVSKNTGRLRHNNKDLIVLPFKTRLLDFDVILTLWNVKTCLFLELFVVTKMI